MGKPIKVPNPVYERLTDASNSEQVPRGAIVSMWMHKADWFDGILSIENTDTDMMQELRGLVDDLYIQAQQAKIDENIPDEYAEMQRELADKLDELVVREQ